MRAALIALVGLVTAVPAPARADRLVPPYDVYEAGPLPEASFARAGRPGDPWLVVQTERQGGNVWVLLALPDGRSGDDLWGTGRPRYLGRVREGEHLVFVAPEISARERLQAGRPLTIAPSNATVLVTREPADRFAERAHHAFQTLEFTVPPPRQREAGLPVPLATALERARNAVTAQPLRTPSQVDSVIDLVDPARLEDYVRTLSEGTDWDTAPIPQKRYYAVGATEGIHHDYIAQQLAASLGTANVRDHTFQYSDPDGNLRNYHNILGRLPSSVPNAGAFLLTAHYDATGVLSIPSTMCLDGRDPGPPDCDCSQSPTDVNADPACKWDWFWDSSPGADDNATGVAVLIEAARVLKGLSFDFDIYFVAFQAEELGLIGSRALADSLASAGTDVYGVINMDMLGYNKARNEVDIAFNEGSEWLADFMVQTAAVFVPDLAVEKQLVSFGQSDQASFWSAGFDAILLLEDINLAYPGYHTTRDLWSTTFPASGRPNSELQFQLASQLAIGTIARFALNYSAPDLALPAGELEVRPASTSVIQAESGVRMIAHVHNYGTSRLSFQSTTTDSLTARVTFYDGDPSQGAAALATVDRKDFYPSGGIVDVVGNWTPTAGEAGFHDIHAVVEGLDPGYAGLEPSSTNNASSVRVFVQSPAGAEPSLLQHYAFPNPVRGTRNDFALYFELSRPVPRLTVDIYDVSGQRVGSFEATGLSPADGNRAGANRISGSSDVAWDGPDLRSGVYLYSIRCFDDVGAVADVAEGKFALVR